MKYVIAINKDVKILDSHPFDTFEKAEDTAKVILEKVTSTTNRMDLFTFGDFISGYLDYITKPLKSLTVFSVELATLPNLGELLADALDDWAIDELEDADEYTDRISQQDVNELNKLLSDWFTKKDLNPNWYHVNSYKTFSVEDIAND